MKKIFSKTIFLFISIATMLISVGCQKTQTYAEMLELERESISKFLHSGGRYTASIPSDTSLIKVSGTPNVVSNEVPFYRLWNDVMMQVVDKGNGRTINKNDRVYFRFLRIDLNHWASSPYKIDIFNTEGDGGYGNWYYDKIDDFFFDYAPDYNVSMSQLYTYGLGIEYPLKYVYDGAIVYLVMPSKVGFAESVSSVVPYLYLVQYIVSKN